MLPQHRNWYRTLAAALAVSAMVPATAAAVPAIDGQGVAAGGGPAVTPQTLSKPQAQSLAAPDQTDRKDGWQPGSARAPQWPTNPKPIVPHVTAASQPSDGNGGIDTEAWVAIGGAALLTAGGLGVAGRKRLQTKRQVA
jgi:hypothetical protein